MVHVFEILADLARPLGVCESLGAASGSLPNGAYTTLRTHRGRRVLRLGEHVRRLEESASLLGTPASVDEASLRRGVAAALVATGHPESRLRLTFAPPRLFVAVEPFTPLPESLYRDGVWCVTVPLRRSEPHSKDTRFIAQASGAYNALPPGAHEGLMIGDDGAILEGLSSNFFAVRHGILHSEEERALRGVTRSLVLEVAQGLIPHATVPLRIDQILDVGECFITSVSRGILPVVKINEQAVGEGAPGPTTRELMRRLADLVEREAESVLGHISAHLP